MRIHDLNGKAVCILGYGREGKAMLRAIHEHCPTAEVTVADSNGGLEHDEQARVWWQLGEGWLENLQKFDFLIVSPGIPPHPLIDAHANKLTNSVQIFLDTVEETGATVIGVTGSKGKSTTSSLITAVLQKAKKDVHLVGNIGEPSIAHLSEAKENTIFVHELSSYQLMRLAKSPHIAVITSFFPEHLDYHGSIENYLEAKSHITKFQKPDDIVFFPEHSPGSAAIAAHGEGRKIPYGLQDAIIGLEQTKLIGAHNLSNIAAACTVARTLGIADKDCIEAIKGFVPLPHRLQNIGLYHNLQWVDDAISTTPESTIAALDALGDNVTTVILGGQDRGNDFTALGKRIAQSKIKTVILFPGSGSRIRKAIKDARASVTFVEVETMQDAVAKAQFSILNSQFSISPIVLLSPASPSYDQYKNFEEKGDLFQSLITKN